MQFQKMIDPFTGLVSEKMVIYTDDDGVIWTVPEGHRFWDLYMEWLSEGGEPLPPSE